MTNIAMPEADREHPVVAWIAVAAIACAIVLIIWARFEVHGTGDLEAALYEEPVGRPRQDGEATSNQIQLDDTVTVSRWAGGFTP